MPGAGADIEPEQLSDFAELVVREFLRGRGYTHTLAALNDEKASKGDKELPAPQSWYGVSEGMGLADMLVAYQGAHGQTSPGSIIEVMADALLKEQSVKSRKPPSVRVLRSSASATSSTSNQHAPTGAGDNFVYDATGKVQLSGSAWRSVGHDTTSTPGPVTLRALKSRQSTRQANAVRASKSEDLLLARIQTARSHKRPAPKPLVPRTSHTSHGTRPRPLPPEQKEKPLIRRLYCPEDFIARKGLGDKGRSPEFWIPMSIRSRMLMRNIHVLKVNVDATKVATGAIQRQSKWLHVTELDHNKTQERLGSKHQMRCALCEYKFSEVNLKLAVPYKAIVDIRQQWASNHPEGSTDGSTPETLAAQALVRPPICYDKVGVCCLCAQFLQNQEVYRPPIEWTKEQQRRKVMRELEQKAALWWDPLRVCESEERESLRRAEERYNIPPLASIASAPPTVCGAFP